MTSLATQPGSCLQRYRTFQQTGDESEAKFARPSAAWGQVQLCGGQQRLPRPSKTACPILRDAHITQNYCSPEATPHKRRFARPRGWHAVRGELPFWTHRYLPTPDTLGSPEALRAGLAGGGNRETSRAQLLPLECALFSSFAVVFWMLFMVHAVHEVRFGILSRQPQR